MFDANRVLFKEDGFLTVQGKVLEDRLSGGLRITAEKAMDVATMGIQFGKKFMFSLTDSSDSTDAAQVKTILSQSRSPQGLPLAVR